MIQFSTLSIHGPIRKFHHDGIGSPHAAASTAPNAAITAAGMTNRPGRTLLMRLRPPALHHAEALGTRPGLRPAPGSFGEGAQHAEPIDRPANASVGIEARDRSVGW